MFSFGDIRDLGAGPLNAFAAMTTTTTKGLQAIAAETADYSTKFAEAGRAYAEELMRVKNPDDFLAVQSKYTQAAYQDYMNRLTKMNRLYSDLASETLQRMTQEASRGQDEAARAAKSAFQASKNAMENVTRPSPRSEH